MVPRVRGAPTQDGSVLVVEAAPVVEGNLLGLSIDAGAQLTNSKRSMKASSRKKENLEKVTSLNWRGIALSEFMCSHRKGKWLRQIYVPTLGLSIVGAIKHRVQARLFQQ